MYASSNHAYIYTLTLLYQQTANKHSFLTFDFYTENKTAANLNLNNKFTTRGKSETKFV